jgi:hypothetical protein
MNQLTPHLIKIRYVIWGRKLNWHARSLCVALACVCWEAGLQGVMFLSATQLGTEDAGSMVGW